VLALSAAPPERRPTAQLGGARVSDVTTRWVPNAVAGPLLVVSGRLAGRAPESPLALVLLDRQGHPVADQPLRIGPPLDPTGLRQRDPRTLPDPQWGRDGLRSSRTAHFQALFPRPPREAVAFRFEAPAPPGGSAEGLGPGDELGIPEPVPSG
jgi:hypothetical protein